MARNKVTTRYQKAERPRKKHRKHWADDILHPSGLSPLARYVEENMGDGIEPLELIQQFQEYECEHEFTELAVASSHALDICPNCGLIERRSR
jgi:hypothetical protein